MHHDPLLLQLPTGALLPQGRGLNGQLDHRPLDMLRHPGLQDRLLAAEVHSRLFAALLVKLLDASKAIPAVPHDIAGLRNGPELLGKFQQPPASV